jgi:hypothetical protein
MTTPALPLRPNSVQRPCATGSPMVSAAAHVHAAQTNSLSVRRTVRIRCQTMLLQHSTPPQHGPAPPPMFLLSKSTPLMGTWPLHSLLFTRDT